MKRVKRFFNRMFKTARETNILNFALQNSSTPTHGHVYPRIVVTEVEIDSKAMNVERQENSSLHTTTCSTSENKNYLSVPSIPEKLYKLQGPSPSLPDMLSKDGFLKNHSICKKTRQNRLVRSAPPSPTMQTDVEVLKIHTKFSSTYKKLNFLIPAEEDFTPYCSSNSIDVQVNHYPSTSNFSMNTAQKHVQTALKTSAPSSTKDYLSTQNMCSLSDRYSTCKSTKSVVKKEVLVSNVSSESNTSRRRIYSRLTTRRDASDLPWFHRTWIRDYGQLATVTSDSRAQSMNEDSALTNRFKKLEELDQATREMLEIDIVKPLNVFEIMLNRGLTL